jgi:hypothetical protein
MKRHGVTESPAGKWTRPEDYLGAMARKRAFRRGRQRETSNEPQAPRLMLSTVPFLALLALLGVLAVAIIIVAYPGNQPPEKAPQLAQKEQGVAPRGWLEEAQKDFHK